MRIALLFHDNAGDGVSLDTLRQAIASAGHSIEHVLDKDDEVKCALEKSFDLFVAAGGDGTVKRAVQALTGMDIPLAILPLGTANNVARSLGIEGPVPQLIADWNVARCVPLDLGITRSSWGTSVFLESIGCGLVPAAIAAVKAHADDEIDESESRLERALYRYHDVLSTLGPCHTVMTLDGLGVEGDFLTLEVLNTPSIGPNLVLSNDVNPGDGFLSVVAIREADREKLAEYLRCRMARDECHIVFPVRHARRVEIAGWNEMHIDGEVHRWTGEETVSIRAHAGAVEVLSGR